MRTLLIRHSAFRRFFLGRLISLLGSAMAPVALAFAVLDASGQRPGDLGVVLAAHMVPLLALLLIGGVAADRYPRRVVLVAVHLGSAGTQGAVAVLLLTGHYSLPAVAALEFGNGVLAAFTSPALRGVVPELVGTGSVRQANALLAAARNGSKVLGPTVGGVLAATAGGGAAIGLDAASFLVAAVLLALVPPGGKTPSAARTRPSVFRQLREGWAEFRRFPWIGPVTASFFVVNLVQTGTWQVLGPLLTRRLAGEEAWGAVLGVRAAGMLVMSAVLYRLVVRRLLAVGRLAAAFGALPLLALGCGLPLPWVLGAALAAGLGLAASGISWDTSLQEQVPAGALSRVASYDDLLSYAAIPLGQLAVGPLSSALGAARVAAGAGALYAAAALLPLAHRAVRELRHGPAAAEPVSPPVQPFRGSPR